VQPVTEQLGQAKGGGDGAHAEQDRDSGRHERAEGEHQNEQRDWDRRQLGFLKVLGEALIDCLVGAAVAEFADEQPRMSRLNRGRRRECRSDAILRGRGVTGDLEGEQRRLPVGRDLPLVARRQRRFDRRHRRSALQPGHETRHRRPVIAAGKPPGRILDQHLLNGALTRKLLGERLLRQPRLAVPALSGLEGHHARGAADHKRHDHEREPAEDRRLAVSGAPTCGTGGEIRPSVHGTNLRRTPCPAIGRAVHSGDGFCATHSVQPHNAIATDRRPWREAMKRWPIRLRRRPPTPRA